MLTTKFRVNWHFRSGKEAKIYFQDGRHLGFLMGTFELQITPMFLTTFRVSWLSGSGEQAKNWFSRWPPWRPSLISNRNEVSYFCSTSHPRCFLPSFESTGLPVQEKKQKIDFQNGRYGGHLGFPFEKKLAIICSRSNPDVFYHVSSQMAFLFRRRSEKFIFKLAAIAAILGFWLERF